MIQTGRGCSSTSTITTDSPPHPMPDNSRPLPLPSHSLFSSRLLQDKALHSSSNSSSSTRIRILKLQPATLQAMVNTATAQVAPKSSLCSSSSSILNSPTSHVAVQVTQQTALLTSFLTRIWVDRLDRISTDRRPLLTAQEQQDQPVAISRATRATLPIKHHQYQSWSSCHHQSATQISTEL